MVNTTIYGKFAFQWYVGDEFTTLGFAPRQDVMWFIVDIEIHYAYSRRRK